MGNVPEEQVSSFAQFLCVNFFNRQADLVNFTHRHNVIGSAQCQLRKVLVYHGMIYTKILDVCIARLNLYIWMRFFAEPPPQLLKTINFITIFQCISFHRWKCVKSWFNIIDIIPFVNNLLFTLRNKSQHYFFKPATDTKWFILLLKKFQFRPICVFVSLPAQFPFTKTRESGGGVCCSLHQRRLFGNKYQY